MPPFSDTLHYFVDQFKRQSRGEGLVLVNSDVYYISTLAGSVEMPSFNGALPLTSIQDYFVDQFTRESRGEGLVLTGCVKDHVVYIRMHIEQAKFLCSDDSKYHLGIARQLLMLSLEDATQRGAMFGYAKYHNETLKELDYLDTRYSMPNPTLA